MRWGMIAVAGLVATTLALGAADQIKVGAKTYYIDTGTDGGVCLTKEVAAGVRETVCRDGANLAAFSTVDGCLDSAGSGYCALERRRAAGDAGSELTCASGAAYFLLVGPDATCRYSRGEMTCASPDGGSTAKADCASGCLRTTGAGNCCEAGIAECPPSTERAR